jgi:hypothetical protein
MSKKKRIFILFISLVLSSSLVRAQEFNYAQKEQRHTLYTSNVLIHHTFINQRAIGAGYAYYLDTSGSFKKMVSADFGISDERGQAIQTSSSIRFDMIKEINDFWRVIGRYHFNMLSYNHRKANYSFQNFYNDAQLIIGRYTPKYFFSFSSRIDFRAFNSRVRNFELSEIHEWMAESCHNRFPYPRRFRGWGHWDYSFSTNSSVTIFTGLIAGYTYNNRFDIVLSPEWSIGRLNLQEVEAYIDIRIM